MSQGSNEEDRDQTGEHSRRNRRGLDRAEQGRAQGPSYRPGQQSSYGYPLWNRPQYPLNGHWSSSYSLPSKFMKSHHQQQQVFMQHQPFGEASQHYGFGRFPHFPPGPPPLGPPLPFENHQAPMFFDTYGRSNGTNYNLHPFPDRFWNDYPDPNSYDRHCGRNFYRSEQSVHQNSCSQYNGHGKRNHFRKGWKNRNGTTNKSSKLKRTADCSKPEEVDDTDGSSEALCHLSNSVESESQVSGPCDQGKIVHSAQASHRTDSELVDLPTEVLEGAVGGVGVDPVTPWTEQNGPLVPDKNLIDEGAICDLDRMFQNQEYSLMNGEHCDDFYISDTEEVNEKNGSNGISGTVSDDEDSESENCKYSPRHCVFSTNHVNFFPDKDTASLLKDKVSQSPSLAQGYCSSERQALSPPIIDRRVEAVCDDAEDTGDFIDTDLPSHNKHILSSSDDMENSSSSNSEDEGQESLYQRETNRDPNVDRNLLPKDLSSGGSDHNCNDLSSLGNDLRRKLGTLSICEQPPAGCLSSSSQCEVNGVDDPRETNAALCIGKNSTVGPNVERLSVPLSVDAGDMSSCSESENGDLSPVEHRGVGQNVCYSEPLPEPCHRSRTLWLDGAAASQQIPLERKHFTNSSSSRLPLGAEGELPPLSPPQCFHSDMFCSYPQRNSTRGRTKSRSKDKNISRQEHVALPASSEHPSQRTDMKSSPSGLSSCSTTADGGACCPPVAPDLLPVPLVNDLNVCCHHQHSHVANGFVPTSPSEESHGANFSNDESNRHQKVFMKFPMDKAGQGEETRESHSASSGDSEEYEAVCVTERKERSSDSGGSEDPLSCSNGDNSDLVLLPMEDDIDSLHQMGGALCAGGVEGVDDDPEVFFGTDRQGQMFNSCSAGAGLSHGCEDLCHMMTQEQDSVMNGMSTNDIHVLLNKARLDCSRQSHKSPEDDRYGEEHNVSTLDLKPERIMIWTEDEAFVMQYKQIATSACGQTAVLNVLKALKISCEKSAVCKAIQTSLRKEAAGIPEYLFSRACAGTTAEELMAGVEKLSGGAVGGRFFHFWPRRKVKLLQWLTYWMQRGAIPMATRNLQQGPHSPVQVPDYWHHQMVYGVCHSDIYLTNPLEIVSERSAMQQLCSDSVLMVRRQDIISRFRDNTDLRELLQHPDPRWRTMNVLGQVVNVLREFNLPSVPGYRLQVTSHITIPTIYEAGITLFMRKDRSAYPSLLNAPQLPLQEQ